MAGWFARNKESYDYPAKAVVEYVLVFSLVLDCWLLNVLVTYESIVKITPEMKAANDWTEWIEIVKVALWVETQNRNLT